MFEKIVLRRSHNGPPLSAGELAEALLFYQNIHIVLDYSSLMGLGNQIGIETLLSLLTRPNVSAIYCQNAVGTHTEKRGGIEHHNFIAYSIAGDQESGQINSRKKLIEYVFSKKLGLPIKRAKSLGERFRFKVPFRDLTNDHYVPGGVLNAAKLDISDEKYVIESTRLAIENAVGAENTPHSFVFNPIIYEKGFCIETDLDLERLSRIKEKRQPGQGGITQAGLINHILDTRADISLASYYGGEFYTSDLNSRLIRTKHSELLRRVGIELDELNEFREIVVGDMPSLREVINSNQRSFSEFLTLLDESEKFREWTAQVNPDEKLVKEYWKEVGSKGWIEKLPGKSIRYAMGAVISAVEPLSGHALSIADSFLLEKLVGGWKPSHFIDTKLAPFLDKGEEENNAL